MEVAGHRGVMGGPQSGRRAQGTLGPGLDCGVASPAQGSHSEGIWVPGTRPGSWHSAGVRACGGHTGPAGSGGTQ